MSLPGKSLCLQRKQWSRNPPLLLLDERLKEFLFVKGEGEDVGVGEEGEGLVMLALLIT